TERRIFFLVFSGRVFCLGQFFGEDHFQRIVRRKVPGTLTGMHQKNRAGPRPCSQKTHATHYLTYTTPRNYLLSIETAAASPPRCPPRAGPPKTWTAWPTDWLPP